MQPRRALRRFADQPRVLELEEVRDGLGNVLPS
jgi:hypothetical protein